MSAPSRAGARGSRLRRRFRWPRSASSARCAAPRPSHRAVRRRAAPPPTDWLHSSTRSQPALSAASAGLGVAHLACRRSRRAPAMLRSSLKTAPSKPSCRAGCRCSQRAKSRPAARRPSDRSRAPASRWPACLLSHSYGRGVVGQDRLRGCARRPASSMCVSALTKPWPGKCLPQLRHAGLQQAVHQALARASRRRADRGGRRGRRSRCCRRSRGRAPA